MSEATVFSSRAVQYLADVEARVRATDLSRIADRVEGLVFAHDQWRAQRCLNMNPAESLMSVRCRALLASDMATRLTEGLPGHKLYPHGIQNEHIDEIEATLIALVRQQFGARFVEWRPVSVCMANAVVFFALLRPGDVVLAQGEDVGGNYSYHSRGPLGLRGARIISIPPRGDLFEIDLDEARALAERERPKMIIVGGSNVLFPYPVRELREIADRVGALLLYDAAHLALFISSGHFQNPLDEGAHIVTVSTAKSLGGPLGGMVFTNDPDIAAKVIGITFPGFVQMRDENKYAAQALALSESAQFGPMLAQRMLSNARALAAALAAEGCDVLGRDRQYTGTHQVFLQLGARAQEFERRCQAANILLSDCALVGDIGRSQRTGVRLATHELTRLGMDEAQMATVARLIARVALRHEEPMTVAREVAALRAAHADIPCSFDD